MLNFCDIVVAILKIVTGRNFSMSGINSGHHNLPTYEMALKSENVEFVLYCGSHFENDNGRIVGHFENGDISNFGRNFSMVGINSGFGTSLSTHISNCDDIGQC